MRLHAGTVKGGRGARAIRPGGLFNAGLVS
jgi:hypothetical protein